MPESVPARVRIAALIALLPVVVYTLACVVYNAPQSPASTRLIGAARTVLEPYFWQDWQLFGPTPATDNDLIYLQARIKRAGTAQVEEASPVEIETAIDRMPRDFRLNPTKLPGVLLAFNEHANQYAQAVTQLKKLPPQQRKQSQTLLDKQYQNEFKEMQRFFSAQARALYPDAEIIAVRATFENKPIVPFSRRYQHPQPREKAKGLLRTSWMAYVPGVAG